MIRAIRSRIGQEVLVGALYFGGTVLVAVGCAGAQAGIQQAQGTAGQLKGETDKVQGQVKAGEQKGGAAKDGEDDDGDRLKAKPSPINTPLDDSLNFAKGDKADWRKVQLGGKPGVATFEIHWDEDASDLDIDVFNKFGDNVGANPPRLNGQPLKKVLVRVDEPGIFYVRVRAPQKKDASIYTMAIKWGGTGGPPTPADEKKDAEAKAAASAPAPASPAPAPAPAPGTPGAPGADPAQPIPFAQDPTKLLGNIVSGYPEGGGYVLYLDKGSANKVKAGMTGNVLEGPDGDKLLEGGAFSITQVIDGKKSIARASLTKPLGKNKRVVINLK
jgi:hypothetical protein